MKRIICVSLVCALLYAVSCSAEDYFEELPFAAESRQIAALFSETIQCADGRELSREALDAIESILIENGIPVIDSDAVYPDYVANSEGMYAFMENVQAGRSAETAYYSVTPKGGLAYTCFMYSDGMKLCMHATAERSESGELAFTDIETRQVDYWALTRDGDFIYCDVSKDRHIDAARFIRLQSVDCALYDMYLKYIAPVGYDDNDLFSTSRSAADIGNINLNSLFDGLYFAETGEYFDSSDFPFAEEPYPHWEIPASLFEQTVWTHFDMPIEEFRERAKYDADSDSYPWRASYGNSAIYRFSTVADIIDCISADNGIVTLVVNVLCPDAYIDSCFVHELTIEVSDDGGFRYIENRVRESSDLY